jgi:glycosyltransferase involved in cell wall biosynthesis
MTERITLAINTRNEELKLPYTLRSCAGVDEIVVADMSSTDGTRDIASAAGAKIVDLPNLGYCELGRQQLLDNTTGDWIILLDADESLSDGGVRTLRSLAHESPLR